MDTVLNYIFQNLFLTHFVLLYVPKYKCTDTSANNSALYYLSILELFVSLEKKEKDKKEKDKGDPAPAPVAVAVAAHSGATARITMLLPNIYIIGHALLLVQFCPCKCCRSTVKLWPQQPCLQPTHVSIRMTCQS